MTSDQQDAQDAVDRGRTARGSEIERTFEILQRCSPLDFLATPSLGDAKKVFLECLWLGRVV